MTKEGLGSHAEESSIHLFDMCVSTVSQTLAWCTGFKDECVRILFLKRGWWDGKGVGRG